MPGDLATEDGRTIAGWVLRVDPEEFALERYLNRYGQVYRVPLPDTERVDLLDAGQPCFLVATGGERRGLCAVGEVVAPASTRDLDGVELVAAEDGTPPPRSAEVELFPLRSPVGWKDLQALKPLAGGELLGDRSRPNPLALGPKELAALESLDLDVVPPNPQQLEWVEAVLGDDLDDPLFELLGADRSYGVLDDGAADGRVSVVEVDETGSIEVGRYETVAEALAVVRREADDLALLDTVAVLDGEVLGDPMAVLRVEDGVAQIFRTGTSTFELFGPAPDGDSSSLGEFDSLDEALAALSEAVEEEPAD